jgi:hypothetical protein
MGASIIFLDIRMSRMNLIIGLLLSVTGRLPFGARRGDYL